MTTYTALLDANVLYPAPIRDILLQLAVMDVYRAKWTAEIHEEWMTALLRNEPHRSRARLERTRDLMDSNTRDCLVDRVRASDPVADAARRERPARSGGGDCRPLRRDRDAEIFGISPTRRWPARDRGTASGRVPVQPVQPVAGGLLHGDPKGAAPPQAPALHRGGLPRSADEPGARCDRRGARAFCRAL